MKKILLVIDMQKDFIDGSLGTKEAQEIISNVINKIKKYDKQNIYATKDTHFDDKYLQTQEGINLPVKHCIKGTEGIEIYEGIKELIESKNIFEKYTFGSIDLANFMKNLYEKENGKIEVEIIGLCTDICVITNVLLLKTYIPELKISLDKTCCAGVTKEKHEAALETIKSCQINVY